jgi:anti-sigma regulatory factor (Ser/Thr protein kinase)
VADFARTHGIAGDTLNHFLSALGEALANAIEHARSEKPIEIEVRIALDRIVATIRDRGVGFASEPPANPVLPEPNAERGRGLPIMRRCCDIFSIESSPGHGTSVLIGCRLTGTAGSAGAFSDPHHAA